MSTVWALPQGDSWVSLDLRRSKWSQPWRRRRLEATLQGSLVPLNSHSTPETKAGHDGEEWRYVHLVLGVARPEEKPFHSVRVSIERSAAKSDEGWSWTRVHPHRHPSTEAATNEVFGVVPDGDRLNFVSSSDGDAQFLTGSFDHLLGGCTGRGQVQPLTISAKLMEGSSTVPMILPFHFLVRLKPHRHSLRVRIEARHVSGAARGGKRPRVASAKFVANTNVERLFR